MGLILGLFGMAQDFSMSNLQSGLQSTPNNNKSVESTYFLTHSTSQTIMSGTSVACSASGLHTDNSYFRTFDLVSDFGINNSIEVTSVDFGIELASGATGSQPATVNIYTLSGALSWANLTLISSESISIADQSLTVLNVPISGIIPSGSVLVVEVFTPNGQVDGNSFFLGSNNLGQTAPSYLAAGDCGITEPINVADLGFPDMQIVMNVNAEPYFPAVPLSNAAIMLALLLMSGFAFYTYRRKMA